MLITALTLAIVALALAAAGAALGWAAARGVAGIVRSIPRDEQ